MPPFRRKRSICARIIDYLNPLDWLLWASEEFESGDSISKATGTSTGLVVSFMFLIARANTGGTSSYEDDVFSDYSGPSWSSWLASLTVWCLTMLSVANAAYTFLRKRHYRLFENNIEVQPSTPSAKRVRVNSSPISSSPLRFLSGLIAESASSRAHPDPKLDVWELAVWDPVPFCLRLFCIFSPGHVLVYLLFLPTHEMDPRPSMTVATTIFLQLLLSLQLLLLQLNFSQQTKDTAVIHKEVLNEYDTKFVQPRLNPPVRHVGTQFCSVSLQTEHERYDSEGEVEVGQPTTIIRRNFRTNPNPNYAKHLSPDDTDAIPRRTVLTTNPAFVTPSQSKLRTSRSMTPMSSAAMRQPQFRPRTSGGGGGGSMGIHSHVNSPLKKATSLYDIDRKPSGTPRNMREMASQEQSCERERSHSPVKKSHLLEREMAARRLTAGGYSRDTTSTGMRGSGERPSTPYGSGLSDSRAFT